MDCGLGGNESRSRRSAEAKNVLPQPGIKPWLLDCPSNTLVAVFNKLMWDRKYFFNFLEKFIENKNWKLR
jgi:hypothetical protein